MCFNKYYKLIPPPSFPLNCLVVTLPPRYICVCYNYDSRGIRGLWTHFYNYWNKMLISDFPRTSIYPRFVNTARGRELRRWFITEGQRLKVNSVNWCERRREGVGVRQDLISLNRSPGYRQSKPPLLRYLTVLTSRCLCKRRDVYGKGRGTWQG